MGGRNGDETGRKEEKTNLVRVALLNPRESLPKAGEGGELRKPKKIHLFRKARCTVKKFWQKKGGRS